MSLRVIQQTDMSGPSKWQRSRELLRVSLRKARGHIFLKMFTLSVNTSYKTFAFLSRRVFPFLFQWNEARSELKCWITSVGYRSAVQLLSPVVSSPRSSSASSASWTRRKEKAVWFNPLNERGHGWEGKEKKCFQPCVWAGGRWSAQQLQEEETEAEMVEKGRERLREEWANRRSAHCATPTDFVESETLSNRYHNGDEPLEVAIYRNLTTAFRSTQDKSFCINMTPIWEHECNVRIDFLFIVDLNSPRFIIALQSHISSIIHIISCLRKWSSP